MNVAIFAAYAMNTPHFETELEIAHKHADQGDSVTMLTCGSEMDACDPNPHHDAPRCAKCMGRRDRGLKLLPSSIRVEPFYRLTEDDRRELDGLQTRFESHEELQSLRLGDFDIGFAVLSSLITKLRDPEADLKVHARMVRGLLRASWTVHRSMCHYLDTNAVDRVYVFNGRFAAMRAVLRACEEKGVDYYTHERAFDLTRYVLLKNTMIHDINAMNRLIRQKWEAAGADSDRAQQASQWYEARDRGDVDEGFVRDQRSKRLPGNWDADKRNIAVFISSEDEFASVSDEWHNPLYNSQVDGLRAIIESLKADPGTVHLYIRTHPNLSLVNNIQTREIAKLEAPFVTVIPPADPVDTYELMRSSVSVLTFGSTTGIEAVYWGVPSILAGKSYYRDYGVTYNPATHEELIELLRTDLKPFPKEPALAYAYFWPTFGTPFEYFTPDGFYGGKFKGVKLRPTFRALVKIGLLRVLYPQRVVRHVSRSAVKRWRTLRNKARRWI